METMQYPTWEVPLLGGGMVIAIIATVHVMIAHFAVGAGIFSAVTEYRAYKYNRPVLQRFLQDFIRYLILISFILGALTGVGIWFSISLVGPEATSALIHQYVWGWATEWVFFIVEIVSGYMYYYTWGRIEPKKHILLGVIYAVSAYMSMVVINGILSFMLTPGGWVENKDFWIGFFNPSYWPSLFLRTISALSLAAIFVCIIVNFAKGYTREERHEVITEAGRWLIPLILMIPFSLWFIESVPEEAANLVKGQAIAMTLFFMFGIAASTLIGFYAYFGLILKKRYINLETAILLGMIAFIATGAMEFVREGIRKPFVIYNYMYSSGILVEESGQFDQTSVLEWAPWTVKAVGVEDQNELTQLQRGEALYRAQCLRCHTYDGVNGINPLIRGWERENIIHLLENLHKEQYFMPPFFGPERDKQALAEYLLQLSQTEEQAVSQAGNQTTHVQEEHS